MSIRNGLTALAIAGLVSLVGCTKQESPKDDAEAAPKEAAPAATQSSTGLPVDLVNVALEKQAVEVGCGLCIYHMDGVDACTPAVSVKGMTVLIADADKFFPGHDHSLCTGKREAVVTGEVKDGELVATAFELVQ